jgi:hypothetical protein
MEATQKAYLFSSVIVEERVLFFFFFVSGLLCCREPLGETLGDLP